MLDMSGQWCKGLTGEASTGGLAGGAYAGLAGLGGLDASPVKLANVAKLAMVQTGYV